MAAALLATVALAMLVARVWHVSLPGARALGLASSQGVREEIPATTNPLLDLAPWERLQRIHYEGRGRNLFVAGPPPPPPGAVLSHPGQAPRPVLPQAPPPPPPLPLRFFGYATQAGEPQRVFLEMGDTPNVVTTGQVIDHRYQIERILKAAVQVKDLRTQEVQTLPLLVPPSH